MVPTEQSPEETQWSLLNGKNEFNVHRVRLRGGGGKSKGKGVRPVKYLQLEPWALYFLRWWQEGNFRNIFLPLNPPYMRNCGRHKTLLMNINQ